MLGEEYTLEYLPLFDEELASAVHYIAQKLRNPDAAWRWCGSDDLACQDGDDGGEHDGGCELQAGRCRYGSDEPRTEEIRR